MSNTKLIPRDVEWFLTSIHPDSVPPEFVADALPLFLPLRIPPADAEQLLLGIMHAAYKAAGWLAIEEMWGTGCKRLRRAHGWQPAEHWADKENRRAHIDATVERYRA